MSNKVSTEQVLTYMNIKYASLNRLMNNHPKPEVAKAGTMRGQPFPAAEGKNGNTLLFDTDKVRQWCAENAEFYRQRKPKPVTITIPLNSFQDFLAGYKRSPHGNEKFDENLNKIDVSERDQFLLIDDIKIVGSDVKLAFDDADDAVWFKLKYG